MQIFFYTGKTMLDAFMVPVQHLVKQRFRGVFAGLRECRVCNQGTAVPVPCQGEQCPSAGCSALHTESHLLQGLTQALSHELEQFFHQTSYEKESCLKHCAELDLECPS